MNENRERAAPKNDGITFRRNVIAAAAQAPVRGIRGILSTTVTYGNSMMYIFTGERSE